MSTNHKSMRVDEIFDVTGTKSLDAGKLVFMKEGINFVGRVNENNGIQGKIDVQLFSPNEPYTITVTDIGNYKYAKFQEEPYYCSQIIIKLKLLDKYNHTLSYKEALYFITLVKKFIEFYPALPKFYCI